MGITTKHSLRWRELLYFKNSLALFILSLVLNTKVSFFIAQLCRLILHYLNIVYVENNKRTHKHKKICKDFDIHNIQNKSNKHTDSPTGTERLNEDILFTKSLYRLAVTIWSRGLASL